MKLEPSEKEIQSFTLEILNRSGWFVWRNGTGSFPIGEGTKKRWFKAGTKGSSDIIGVTPHGKMAAIEVKRNSNKKPSIEQVLFLEEVSKRGGFATVIDSIENAQKLALDTTL